MSEQRLYSMIWFYLRGLVAFGVCWAMVVYLSGCNKFEPAANDAKPSVTHTGTSPRGRAAPIPDVGVQTAQLAAAKIDLILTNLTQAYRSAKSYADAGQLVQKMSQNGKPLPPQTLDFSLSFQRPNKIQMRTCGVELASDGTLLRAIVPGIEGQVLTRVAPPKLRKEEFLDPAFADPELVRGLLSITGPIQLNLLLDDQWLPSLRKEATAVSLLEPQDIAELRCERIQFTAVSGAIVLWVDDAQHVLRRMEFLPTPAADANGNQMESAVVEFAGARLNGPIAVNAFNFEAPADAIEVKRLVALDRPMAPPDLFGKPISDFTLASLDGSKMTRQTLAGKPAVLLFWSMQSLPCMDVLTALNRVASQTKLAGKVAFYAVNTDGRAAADADLALALKRLNVSLRIARDQGQHAEKTFNVQYAPTMIVLGPDGLVQDSEVGKNPELEIQLPATLEKLLAGESTFAEAKARSDSRLAIYQRAIQDAQREADSVVREIPQAKILRASEPAKLKLVKLWNATGIKSPGNLLIVPSVSGPPEMWVHDRWQAVAQLDVNGAVIARHDLKLPPKTPVASLRTAVDQRGQRYYAAFASPQQQFYLYDANWNLLTAIPDAEEGKHEGISDVQFVDTKTAGELEIAIGFWGADMGVHRFTLQGKRVWRDRNIAPVLGIAQAPRQADGHAELLFTSGRGQLLAYDFDGNPTPQHNLPVGTHPLLRVFTAASSAGARSSGFCCLVQDDDGHIGSVIGGRFGETKRWGYPLPSGIYTEPLEIVTSAALVDGAEPQWIIAGPDGSVHILANDGTPIDHFATGAAISGLAATRIGNNSLLLIASASGLQAWKVEPGQMAARDNPSR